MNIFGKSCYAKDKAGNYIMNGNRHKYDVNEMFERVKKYYNQIDDINITANGKKVKNNCI